MEDIECERCQFTVPKTLIHHVVIQTKNKRQISQICDLCLKKSQKEFASIESALKCFSIGSDTCFKP
jgi:hypothetical protein